MAILAIKGHSKRGKEVIEILEMLGYINQHNYSADADSLCFYGDKNTNIIYYDWVNNCYEDEDIIVFTLEEFLEKYPYKVGDKIKCWINGYCSINNIKDIQWDSIVNEIKYKIQDYWYSTMNIQPYNEETMEDKPNLLQQLKDYFDNTPIEVIEKEWHEYDKYNEIGPKINEYLEYVNNIKQPKYPKTYDKCCEILSIPSYYKLRYYTYEHGYNEYTTLNKLCSLQDKLNILGKLLICRDAYWRIAGEEMGLDKTWEPDWKNNLQHKHYISTEWDEIKTNFNSTTNKVLAFPTEEMRDTFFENFKELIEICKELL